MYNDAQVDITLCSELHGFDWNPVVESKLLEKHKLFPEEVEEACFDPASIWLWEDERRYFVFGKAESGRYIFVLVRLTDDCYVHPITAREMNKRQRTFYLQGGVM